MISVLYLTRNGLLEPLGQSQVFAYLQGLSAQGYRITLITHEKPEDWSDSRWVQSAQAKCERCGIRWQPRAFRRNPRFVAPALSLAWMMWEALQLARCGEVRLLHVRSYLPAAVAWVVWRVTGTPFIFDMRALWPEELITAGHLRRGSMLHQGLLWLERRCLQDASGVVSLTQAAVSYLQRQYPRELNRQRIAVIPTCADLQRFQPAEPANDSPLVIGCIGTVLSGWFLVDWLRAFFEAITRADSKAQFEIISRDSPEAIFTTLSPALTWTHRLRIKSAAPAEMPSIVQSHTASVMFYAGGATSELGRSPTRMAEVLGCGRPVIANAGVGDVEQIVRQYRVGVLARDVSNEAMDTCVSELLTLLKDPQLASRCRSTAEQLFSLESGIAAYRQLYTDILS